MTQDEIAVGYDLAYGREVGNAFARGAERSRRRDGGQAALGSPDGAQGSRLLVALAARPGVDGGASHCCPPGCRLG